MNNSRVLRHCVEEVNISINRVRQHGINERKKSDHGIPFYYIANIGFQLMRYFFIESLSNEIFMQSMLQKIVTKILTSQSKNIVLCDKQTCYTARQVTHSSVKIYYNKQGRK